MTTIMTTSHSKFRDLDKPNPLEPLSGKKVALLIDGDIFAFRAAAAIDRPVYKVGDQSFKYYKEALQYAEDKSQIETSRDTGELKYAIYAVTSMLEGVYSLFSESTTIEKTVIFLSSEENFRKQRNSKYKANREAMYIPVHLGDVKQYLIDFHGASVTAGIEADDAICIEHTSLCGTDITPVIVSIDKDFKQIPGFIYNFVTNELTQVSGREALINLFSQALIGDTADNIPGIRGIGPVKACKFFEEVDSGDIYYATLACYQCSGKTRDDLDMALYMLYLLRYEEEFAIARPWEKLIKDIGQV